MQELDVSKPYQDKKEKSRLEYVGETILNDKRIIISKCDQWEEEQLYIRTPEQLENIPQQPAFSWDKPIRHVSSGAICVYKNRDNAYPKYPWYCVFKHKDGYHFFDIFTDDGDELENYEPEERYEICQLGLSGPWDVRKQGIPIASFDIEEDAEIFKRAKEQGL